MGKIFMRGLLTIAPITLTIAIMVWLINLFERTIGSAIQEIVPQYYFPGLGIVVTFIFIFVVGVFINSWVIQKFVGVGDTLFQKIPLVKTLYQSIADMLNFFNTPGEAEVNKVCTVDINGYKLLALVTRDHFDGLPAELGKDDDVVVFLPMSYQIGGFAIVVKKNQITPIDMTVEDAMRFVITAGAAAKVQPPVVPVPGKKE